MPIADRLISALADRYAIEREIGRGGMATVYLAEDLKHRRKVAVKVLEPDVASSLGAERFLREIETAARLNHPHILPLYDSGTADGFLYYVMPYVRGESLRHRLDRDRQLPIEEALTITQDVAAALGHAHARGVIHRDIKPENILIQEGEAMVADFGIALAVSAAASERLTLTGLLVGTSEYMSPEQASGDLRLDERTDVYSLACVLYEMLAGEPPYTGPTAQAVITKRLVDPVPGVRRVRERVPVAVERSLTQALATAPADRFASAAAFAEALSAESTDGTTSRCVAVLPFLNLSADPENEYFADGITEDVIAQLSKVRDLKVISRTSVMLFKKREQSLREIGAKLGAGTVLEGSVRRAGDRVRVVAQLIDAAADQHLWAETYDRQLTDIFAIQADVALHIAAALEAELSPDEQTRIRREPTADLHAYQLYLQGRQCFIRYTDEEMRKAIDYFEQAIDRDPGYALPHAALALANTELGEIGVHRSDQDYARAKWAAARALELDGELAEAHTVLGVIRCIWEFDWAGSEHAFRRALELNPNSADTFDLYGRLLSSLGRFDEAVEAQRRARELDPLAHPLDVATALLRAGRYDEAIQEARHCLAFVPGYSRAHATLGWACLRKEMTEEGLAGLERAVALSPGDTMWLAQLGEAYALAGRAEDAREILRQMEEMDRERFVSPYHFAYVYTGLGEHDAALDQLERAFDERSGAVYGIKGSFLFEPLRSHPRFTALLKKINLA